MNRHPQFDCDLPNEQSKLVIDLTKRVAELERELELTRKDFAECELARQVSAAALASIELAPGMNAQAALLAVQKLQAAEQRVAELETWTHQHGAALVPHGQWADTFGDGMRCAKQQVAALLARRAAKEANRG